MSVTPPEVGFKDDTRILEALDFEPDIECDRDKCTNTQEWVELHECCSSEWRLCTKCREQNLKILRDHTNIKCKACGYSWDPRTTIMVKWTRL